MILCPLCAYDFGDAQEIPDHLVCDCGESVLSFRTPLGNNGGTELHFGAIRPWSGDFALHQVRRRDGELRKDGTCYGHLPPDGMEAAFREAVLEAIARRVLSS